MVSLLKRACKQMVKATLQARLDVVSSGNSPSKPLDGATPEQERPLDS
jgi:hypothetical protein